MAKKLSRNAPCPCGSGKKYKHCCLGKDFDWVEMENGQIGRRVPLSSEALELLERQRQAFVQEHGREPEFIFEGAPPLEVIEHLTVQAMKKAGIDPAFIYAYEKTNGLMLNEHNERMVPESDVAEWEAAIDEYERVSGTKASRRRMNKDDIDGIIGVGP